MNKLTVLLGLGILLSSNPAIAQVSEEEMQALRAQIEMLTKPLRRSLPHLLPTKRR